MLKAVRGGAYERINNEESDQGLKVITVFQIAW